ncbi:hypothetical protein [Halobacterium zhouii]|uniref:hypothetical protein n=1 Tax=Halobacterium zhouii TaxID=2902624 RepID=UPI001E2D0A5D|nr:hypothetical protein [Halobacterium zhouii]
MNGLRHSARLNYAIRALRSAGRAVDPGISPRVLAIGGRLDSATPDVDVEAGRFTNYLGRQSQTTQYRIARQVDQISGSTWQKLDDLGVADPATKVARGVRTSGATFRRALGRVSDPAKGALLRLTDDAATERAMLRAWENGEISTRQLAKGVRRFDELDASEKAFVRESLTESDTGTMGLLNLDVCNSPCEDPIDWAFELSRNRRGLDNTETKQFLQAVREGEDVSIGPGASREQILESIDWLAEKDVNGLDSTIRDIAGSETGYKQIAGESHVARYVQGGGISAEDITMQRDILASEIPDDAPKASTEVDVVVDESVTIDGETLDSPAIESKYLEPETRNEFTIKQEFGDPEDKLVMQAAAGQDNIVVVTTEEFLESYQNRFDTLSETVRQHSSVDSDVTIKVTTYERLES